MSIRLPLFVVFEGIDGSGKTTLCERVHAYLTGRGVNTVILREPTDGPWGIKLKEILKGNAPADPETQVELFIRDREYDVERNVLPAIRENRLLLMDRYYFSNAAYQGAMGVPPQSIIARNREKGFPEPERVYFIDITPEHALERIAVRNDAGGESIFEKKDFLDTVRKIFLSIADDRFLLLNGSYSVETLVQCVVGDLISSFGEA